MNEQIKQEAEELVMLHHMRNVTATRSANTIAAIATVEYALTVLEKLNTESSFQWDEHALACELETQQLILTELKSRI